MNQRRNSINSILSDPDLKKVEKQIENIPYINRTSKKSPKIVTYQHTAKNILAKKVMKTKKGKKQ